VCSLRRNLSITVLIALLLSACRSREVKSAGPPPPVPVTVAVATEESVPEEIRAIGGVEPSATVQIKSQIAGELTAVHFTEGGNVQKGDLLIEIDSRPYQEALRQAEAATAKDRAQLQQAEANLGKDNAQLKNAEILAARYDSLRKEGVTSREQSEQMQTNMDSLRQSARADQAAIESSRASVDTDIAAVERAKLDLSYCQIRSPISGRAGNLLVHAGNLVKVSDVALVVINQIEPIFVSFGVPEQYLGDIRKNNSDRKLPVQVSLQEDAHKIANGFLSVIDNTVDNTTGTIRLKATFDNRERVLWPGQLVNVALTLDTLKNVTIVPAEAVQAGQQGQFVYVVKADKGVEIRMVTVGRTLEKRIVLDKGVAAGETVVTDGQLLLYPGAHVLPVAAEKVEPGAKGI
jgi:membrane fusion protein, multidrug efflux system